MSTDAYNTEIGSAGVLRKEDFGKKPEGVYARWMAELEEAQKDEKRRGFYANASKAIEVYSVQLGEEKNEPKYNIFWAYVNLMLDSIFASPPKSVIRAFPGYRNKPEALRAEEILSRNVDFYIASPDGKFYERAKRAVKDLMLVGRGQLWPRYTITEGTPKKVTLQPGDSPPDGAEIEEDKGEKYYLVPEVKDEDIEIDYVHWKDYRESVSRTPDETRWKSKRTFLTKTEAEARFGKKIAADLTYSSKYQSTSDREASDPQEVKHQIYQRTEIWEIHSLEDRKVFFISPGYEKPIKVPGDMNAITGFYPCPKALCATTSNESTVPTAEYKYVSFLVDRINTLQKRLDMLTGAAKVIFAYNAKYASLSDIFNSLETAGIPIEEWDAFAGEDGGFEGVTDFIPIEQYMAAIERIRAELAEKKQEFYELTGYLELTHEDPSGKTPAERQAEALFANPRTQQKQKEIVRFMRDIVSIVAELICQKFEGDKMLTIAGYPTEPPTPPALPPALPPAAPPQMPPMEGPMPPDMMGGGAPPEPPAPPEPDPAQVQFEKDMAEFTLNQDAIRLLKDNVRRHFSIMIETDSTIAVDNRLEKRDRIEFLNMSQAFFQNLQGMSQTGGAFVESACEFFLFGLDAFRVARPLEEKLRKDLKKFQEAQENPPAPPPDPRIVAAEKNFELGLKKLELAQQTLEVTSQQKSLDSQMKFEGKMTELQQENQQFMQQLQVTMQDKMAQAEARIQSLEVQLEVAEINKGAVITAAQIKAAQLAEGEMNVASLGAQTELQKAQIKANADVSQTAIAEHNKMQMHEKGVVADVMTKSHGATLQHKAALKGHEIAAKKAENKPKSKE